MPGAALDGVAGNAMPEPETAGANNGRFGGVIDMDQRIIRGGNGKLANCVLRKMTWRQDGANQT